MGLGSLVRGPARARISTCKAVPPTLIVLEHVRVVGGIDDRNYRGLDLRYCSDVPTKGCSFE